MSAAAGGQAALLRQPGFGLVLLYRIATILSYQIVAVTVGWHVYELTRKTPRPSWAGSSRPVRRTAIRAESRSRTRP